MECLVWKGVECLGHKVSTTLTSKPTTDYRHSCVETSYSFLSYQKVHVTMKQGNANYFKSLYNFKKGFLKIIILMIYLAWCFSRRHHQRKNNSSSQRRHLWSGQFSTLSSFNSMYFDLLVEQKINLLYRGQFHDKYLEFPNTRSLAVVLT